MSSPELSILAAASAARIGVLVRTSDFDLARQRLYKAKKGIAEFSDLQLRKGAAPGELLIVHSGAIAPASPLDAIIEDAQRAAGVEDAS